MAARSISDLPGSRHLPLIGNAHQVRLNSLVAELLGFTMSPKGLRVRLRERTPAIAA